MALWYKVYEDKVELCSINRDRDTHLVFRLCLSSEGPFEWIQIELSLFLIKKKVLRQRGLHMLLWRVTNLKVITRTHRAFHLREFDAASFGETGTSTCHSSSLTHRLSLYSKRRCNRCHERLKVVSYGRKTAASLGGVGWPVVWKWEVTTPGVPVFVRLVQRTRQ